MKQYIHLLSIIVALFITGCANDNIKPPKEPTYEWCEYTIKSGDYGLNEANSEKFEQYKEELKKVIDKANETKKRIPPGICAEYGYMLYQSGKSESAREYFDKEVLLYPESKRFMKQFVEKLYGKASTTQTKESHIKDKK